MKHYRAVVVATSNDYFLKAGFAANMGLAVSKIDTFSRVIAITLYPFFL